MLRIIMLSEELGDQEVVRIRCLLEGVESAMWVELVILDGAFNEMVAVRVDSLWIPFFLELVDQLLSLCETVTDLHKVPLMVVSL